MKKLAVVAASLALCMASQTYGSEDVSTEQKANLKAIAYSATLAKFVSTNSQAFVSALSPSVRERWQTEERKLRVENVQFFLPDFFKVAYAYNGSVSGDAFCFGLYNPFYDHALICKAKGLDNPDIVDFKWVSGATFRGDASVPKYPPATGVDPADEYFPVLMNTAGKFLAAFNRAFVGSSPDAAFASVPTLDDQGIKSLLDIAAFRTAQAVKMAGDESACGLATLATMAFRDERLQDQPFLASDDATRATAKTISGLSQDLQRAFRTIGYFEADAEKCVVFYNKEMPTFLTMARTRDGNTIRLGMFDFRIADGWEKKINR